MSWRASLESANDAADPSNVSRNEKAHGKAIEKVLKIAQQGTKKETTTAGTKKEATKKATQKKIIEKDTPSIDPRYINILILGETGTGKSTFINAITNYYDYDSFDDVRKHKLLVPIPATNSLWDINDVKRKFSVGVPDEKEIQGTGAAATQDVKTYDIPTENGFILRLIDTPGMGDPRGVDTDDENCEKILSHLSEYEDLHAICFLVKSNQSRITVLFEYCFKQILSRLEKSASDNIIFMFTNTKGDYYKGGNTHSCLKNFVKDIKENQKEANINFDRNLFFLDNEAFRILAALENDIELPDDMMTSAVKSWNKSASECKRLISYIKGDDSNPPLPPHILRNSISINEARRLIDNISKPLADISDSIQDNIVILNNHEKKLGCENQNLDFMKKMLYIPVVNLKVEELKHPVTTCMSDKCVEYIQVENKKLSHYKQRCHEPCGLKNVPALHVGHPNLRDCAAMNGQQNCQKCGCHFTSHVHVYQLTSKYDDRIMDAKMVQNIKTEEQAVNATKQLIKKVQDRRVLLEKEQDDIIEATAMFAHFVQHNAITPFNDAYKSYIEYEIVRERGRGQVSDQEQIAHLEDMLKRYELKKIAFDETLNLGLHYGERITAETVISRINSLHNLHFSGATLKELMRVTSNCRRRSWADSTVHFIKEKYKKFKNKFSSRK